MARTNREILTGGKKYTQNKAKKHAVEEVVFDKGSREEYLTGFHKRKLERQKKAQDFHKEQERLAKIEERKQQKLEKQKDLVKQMEKYKQNLKELAGDYETSSDEEVEDDDDEKDQVSVVEETVEETFEDWEGFNEDDDKPKGILKKREIYGEDGTEVVIEDISSNSLEEIAKLNYVNLKKSQKVLEESIDRAIKYAVIAGASKPKKQPKKKFRYLTKNERRDNNRKAISNKRRK